MVNERPEDAPDGAATTSERPAVRALNPVVEATLIPKSHRFGDDQVASAIRRSGSNRRDRPYRCGRLDRALRPRALAGDLSAKARASSARQAPLRRRNRRQFSLDVPLRRLQHALELLGYDAKFTYLTNRDHFNPFEGDLMTHIAVQMYEAARPRSRWLPAESLNQARTLAK